MILHENKMLDHKKNLRNQHETIVLIIKVNEDMNNLKKSLSIKKMSRK
jgi:hypothetical protein